MRTLAKPPPQQRPALAQEIAGILRVIGIELKAAMAGGEFDHGIALALSQRRFDHADEGTAGGFGQRIPGLSRQRGDVEVAHRFAHAGPGRARPAQQSRQRIARIAASNLGADISERAIGDPVEDFLA